MAKSKKYNKLTNLERAGQISEKLKKYRKARANPLDVSKTWADKKFDPKVLKKFQEQVKASKAPMAKRVAKKAAKKTVGKVLKKLIPGVGAAAIAHDVLKGVSKATCSKRGGKWASGKCVGAKKTKFKPGSKVKDPISKR